MRAGRVDDYLAHGKKILSLWLNLETADGRRWTQIRFRKPKRYAESGFHLADEKLPCCKLLESAFICVYLRFTAEFMSNCLVRIKIRKIWDCIGKGLLLNCRQSDVGFTSRRSDWKGCMNAMQRMRHGCLIIGLVGGIVLAPRPAEAQYTDNDQTNIISGITNDWEGDYLVGSNTFADVLLIQNSGVLSNWNCYLGYEVESSNNSVLVTDPGSLWNNSSNLYVGYSGSGNNLVISNGAQAANSYGYVGFNSESSSNTVLVSGTGSVWTNFNGIRVGYHGVGNSMVISNGGYVVNGEYGIVGCYSSNNSVLVTGPAPFGTSATTCTSATPAREATVW